MIRCGFIWFYMVFIWLHMIFMWSMRTLKIEENIFERCLQILIFKVDMGPGPGPGWSWGAPEKTWHPKETRHLRDFRFSLGIWKNQVYRAFKKQKVSRGTEDSRTFMETMKTKKNGTWFSYDLIWFSYGFIWLSYDFIWFLCDLILLLCDFYKGCEIINDTEYKS